MNGCAAAIMRMWLSTDRKRLPLRPQGLAQSKTGRCSVVEVRRAFERHGAADVLVGGLDVLLARSRGARAGRSPARSSFSAGTFSVPVRNSSPSVQRLNTNEMSNAVLQRVVELLQRLVGEALGLERGVVDGGRLRQRAVADGVGLDLGDLGLARSRARAGPRGTEWLMILK